MTVKFKGGLEPKVYTRLEDLKRKGDRCAYETTKLPYTVTSSYNCDFTFTMVSGATVYLEVKGYFSYKDRVKMQNVCEQYPDHDIRMVFQKNNKLNKKATMTYGDWCDKRGIPWILEKDITREWLEKDFS